MWVWYKIPNDIDCKTIKSKRYNHHLKSIKDKLIAMKGDTVKKVLIFIVQDVFYIMHFERMDKFALTQVCIVN